MPTTLERLVILGLDGATWTVLDPMRRRGLMPNLDSLLARSAHGTLRSIVPPVTSAAWTTMMTGCGPARHGVFDHRYYDVAAGQMKVNHAGSVATFIGAPDHNVGGGDCDWAIGPKETSTLPTFPTPTAAVCIVTSTKGLRRPHSRRCAERCGL